MNRRENLKSLLLGGVTASLVRSFAFTKNERWPITINQLANNRPITPFSKLKVTGLKSL